MTNRPFLGFIGTRPATIDAKAGTWEGTNDNWIYYQKTATRMCELEIPTESTSANTSCSGCEFAFDVTFDPITAVSGSLCTASVGDTQAGWYSLGNPLSLGYDADYAYGGSTFQLAMLKYGSNWYVSGAPDNRWDNDMLHLLDVLTGNDFEAVDTSVLLVDADSAQTQ